MLHREGIYFAVLKTIRFSNKEPPVRFIAWPLEVFCDNIGRTNKMNVSFKTKSPLVLYIHGKGGNAAECEHYKPLFPAREVIGLDYQTSTPWEAEEEIRGEVERLKKEYEDITLIANSIGAFFCMVAGIEGMISKAYFISPVVDMERLICEIMRFVNITEEQLKAEGVIPIVSGEDLSWDYLCYVREHPIKWSAPTEILYGENDNLTSSGTVVSFAREHNAKLTVMEGGEHWFHTEDQMRFLDEWIRKCEAAALPSPPH